MFADREDATISLVSATDMTGRTKKLKSAKEASVNEE
jgi:hypothetical protein